MSQLYHNFRKQYCDQIANGKPQEAERILTQAVAKGYLSDLDCSHIRTRGLAFQPETPPKIVREDSPEANCRKTYGFYHPELVFSDKGSLPPHPLNLRLALENHPKFQGRRFTFSTFLQKSSVNDQEVSDHTIHVIQEELITIFKKAVKKVDVNQAVEVACHRKEVHEPQAWFNDLPEATTDILDTWLIDYLGAPNTPINRVIGRKWLISAVARTFQPGCYVEGCLILQGETGVGKSTTFKILAPNADWFTDTNVDLGDTKKAAEAYRGKLIVEMAELEGLRKSALTATKTFLTTQFDTYRPAYASRVITVPRSAVYGGTTNNETFLTDTTGNRRFWCVAVGSIDLNGLRKVARSLWREALDAYRAGETWTLSTEEKALLEEVNQDLMVDNRVEVHLEEELSKYPDPKISSNYLLNTILKDFRSVSSQELANFMKKLGWKKKAIKSEGRTVQGYVRPSADI